MGKRKEDCHLSQECESLYKSKLPHFRKIILISASLITAIFFLCLVFVLVQRYCINRRRRRRQQQQQENDLLDEESGPTAVVEHHIWNIRTVGLPQSAIESIAVVKYKRGDCPIQGTECSVCLTEFEEEEDVRLLPKCGHAFHISCIDAWLISHTNCPSCRAPIDFENATPTEDQAPAAVVEDEAESSTRLQLQESPPEFEAEQHKAPTPTIGERIDSSRSL